MGILSPLMFAQQGANAIPGLEWNGQAWVMPSAPRRSPSASPQYQAAIPGPSPGQIEAPQTPLAQLPTNAAPQVARATWDQRLMSGLNNPLFQTGLSIMGHAQNGGDWAQVGQDVRQINEQQTQRRLLEDQQRRQRTQDQREGTLFQRQQTEWGQADQQRRDWEAALGREADPRRQAQLRAMGPQNYGQFIGQERQMEFQAREGQLDRDAQVRAAQVRAANENSLGRYFQSMDAQTLGELNQQAAQLQAVGLPQLRALRGTIQSAGQELVGRPIDYNTRIQLGQVFNGASSDRQTLEVWRAQILGPALETLRGLGAMSEREMEAAVNSFSNPNMQLGSSLQLIDEKIATAERRIATAQAASQYFRDAGGLTGTINSAGQDWPTYLQEIVGQTPGAGTTDQNMVPRGGYQTPPPQAIADLRRDTSAAARREFDQTFGPGAAARALAGRRSSDRAGGFGPLR